ncbi:aminoglycoside phosphotransferase family protein [Bremerella cremea]|uniref:aminoglycoside phosphotransferase family protein n=1 Tax=Bremerella cremea TaxID=1031537 RepID=UPI0031E7811E
MTTKFRKRTKATFCRSVGKIYPTLSSRRNCSILRTRFWERKAGCTNKIDSQPRLSQFSRGGLGPKIERKKQQEMTSHKSPLEPVLSRFPAIHGLGGQIEPCRGGLSGSKAWKVVGRSKSFCLKRMPADFPVNLLQAIHTAVQTRRQQGMTTLPSFVAADNGETYIQHQNHFWELQEWLPGEPPNAPPDRYQKQEMLGLIAQFHALSSDLSPALEVSPGAERRLAMFQYWNMVDIPHTHALISKLGHPQWQFWLHALVDSFVTYRQPLGSLLQQMQAERTTLRTCIGDPRLENYRFDGPHLVGMFDLGSLRRDSIALDVSRLAGEMSTEGVVDWEEVFALLPASQRLTPSEERLAIELDASNVLLTGLNWVQWLTTDGYSFENCDQVSSRLQHFHTRMVKIDGHLAWKI